MSSNRVEIIISGPQGTGKTILASVIASLLSAIGVRDMVYFDENQPVPFLSLINLREIKMILSRQRVAIHTTNETIDLEKDFSPLSVDDALELLLTPGAFAQGTHRDRDSGAVLQNDPENKTHHTDGKSNCPNGHLEDRHENNTWP